MAFVSIWTDDDLVFTAEPQDAVVSKNSSVVIDCGVPAGWLRDSMEDAGPAPMIEWKRDGVLLSLNGENRRYKHRPPCHEFHDQTIETKKKI